MLNSISIFNIITNFETVVINHINTQIIKLHVSIYLCTELVLLNKFSFLTSFSVLRRNTKFTLLVGYIFVREVKGNKVPFKSIIYMSHFNPFPQSCLQLCFLVYCIKLIWLVQGTKGKVAFNHSHFPHNTGILFYVGGLMFQLEHSTHADCHFLSCDFQEFWVIFRTGNVCTFK